MTPTFVPAWCRAVWWMLLALSLSCVADHPQEEGDAGPEGLGSNTGGKGAAIGSAEACVFSGAGGDNLLTCRNITIAFDPPLSPDDVVTVRTDPPVDDRLASSGVGGNSGVANGFSYAIKENGKTSRVVLSLSDGRSANEVAYPRTVIVEVVAASGATVKKTYSDLQYACHKHTSDDWCWEAEPLTVSRQVTEALRLRSPSRGGPRGRAVLPRQARISEVLL